MRCTKANIYLQNLVNNYKNIKKMNNDGAICAAVKANAYGHGAIEVSKTLENLGCDFLGVATLYEAKELIENSIGTPIILFSLITPEEIKDLVELEIEPVVTTLKYIDAIDTEAKKQNKIIKLHLKVDTGMSRIGCEPRQTLFLARQIEKMKSIKLNGVCTHLSTSESTNQEFTIKQLDIFSSVVSELKHDCINPPYIHAINSGGVINDKGSMFNMVRQGINLYGYPPAQLDKNITFKPVLELKSKIVELKKVPKNTSISYGRTYITKKEELIATIPIGYADGYPRILSNRAEVSINGKLYPIVGSICMDQIMVKVDKEVSLFDDVTLLGAGQSQPNAESLAKLANTISYEILTSIHRVKRYYIK